MGMRTSTRCASLRLSTSLPSLLLLLLVSFTLSVDATPSVNGVSGCVDYSLGDGRPRTRECRPGQVVTVWGEQFSPLSSLHLIGQLSNYTIPAFAYNNSTRFIVRLSLALSPLDVNRSLSVFVTDANSTSPTLPSAIGLTGSPFTVSSVSGCFTNEGNRTSQCVSGQIVQVNGTGFSQTMQLALGGAVGGACSLLSPTSARCPLPSVVQFGFAWLPAQLQSGGAVSGAVGGAAVQYISTPTVRRVSGCHQASGNGTAGCVGGQSITVEGTGFLVTANVTIIYGAHSAPCCFLNRYGFVNSNTLTCTLPYLLPAYWSSWLSLQVNNTYPLSGARLIGPASLPFPNAVRYSAFSSSAASLSSTTFSTAVVRASSATSPARAASASVRPSSSSSPPTAPTAAVRAVSSSARVSSSSTAPLSPYINSIAGCASGPTIDSTFNCSYLSSPSLKGGGFGANLNAVSLSFVDAVGYAVNASVTGLSAGSHLIFLSPSVPPVKWGLPFTPRLTVAGVAATTGALNPKLTFGAGASIVQLQGCVPSAVSSLSTFNCAPGSYLSIVGANFGTIDVSASYIQLVWTLGPGDSHTSSCPALSVVNPIILRCIPPALPADVAIYVTVPGDMAYSIRTTSAPLFFTMRPSSPVLNYVTGCSVNANSSTSGCAVNQAIFVYADNIPRAPARLAVFLSAGLGVWVRCLVQQVPVASPSYMSVLLPAVNSSWYNVKLQVYVQVTSLSNNSLYSAIKPLITYTSPAPVILRATGCAVQFSANQTSSCDTSGGDIVSIAGLNFDQPTLRVWVGNLPVRSWSLTSAADGVWWLAVRLPSPPVALWSRFLPVQVESRNLNATIAPELVMYGLPPSPPAPSTAGTASKWGLSIDEFVIVIIALVAVVCVLLVVQALWCLSRFGGVRLGCVQRWCPTWVAGHAGRGRGVRDGARGEEKGAINLGLLQHDQLQMPEGQAQPFYRPYTPAAAAFAPPASVQAPLPAPPMAVYQQWSQPQGGYASAMAPQQVREGAPPPLPAHTPILYPRSFVPSPQYYQ